MLINKLKLILPIICFCGVILTACQSANTEIIPYTETRFFFDTLITVTIYEDRQDVLDKAIDLCAEYQERLSLNDEGSEIKLINESKGNTITVTDEMLTILNAGIKYGELTNGSFDITIKPLGELWNIGNDGQNIPNEKDILSSLELVDYSGIKISGNDVTLPNEDSLIDLGAISKGFIADQIKELLVNEGIKSGIINLGGNIQTIGAKPDGSAFEIGIQKPFGTSTESISSVSVIDQCVVTAGVYQRYFEDNDTIYHHILDTTTGYPVDNGLWSVTIIADDAMTADILSTVCFTMGLDQGVEYISNLDNIDAVFVTDQLEVIEVN